jgi:hypothetical protein
MGNGLIDAVLIPLTLSAVEISRLANSLKVFPNPVRNFITIEAQLAAPSNVSIEIFSLVGQRVMAVDLGSIA